MIKANSKNFLLVVFTASLFIAVMFGGRSSLSLTIEGIGQSDYLNYLQISFSFALGQLVTGAVAPFSGMLADKYGTGRTLIIGVFMTIIGCLLIPLSSNPITLSISLGIISSLGVGIAGLPVVLASVNKLIEPRKVGLAFGFVNAGQSLGQLVIAPLAGFIVLKFGWVDFIYFLCLLLLIIMPCSFILRSRLEESDTSGENEVGLKKNFVHSLQNTELYLLSFWVFRLRFSRSIYRHAYAWRNCSLWYVTCSLWMVPRINWAFQYYWKYLCWMVHLSAKHAVFFILYLFVPKCNRIAVFTLTKRSSFNFVFFGCFRLHVFFCYSSHGGVDW